MRSLAYIIQSLAPIFMGLTEWACIYNVLGKFIKNSSLDYVTNLGFFNMIFKKEDKKNSIREYFLNLRFDLIL